MPRTAYSRINRRPFTGTLRLIQALFLLSYTSTYMRNTREVTLSGTCPQFFVDQIDVQVEISLTQVMRRFLNGQMPAYPELNLACVDVRDVAKAHVEAMRCPESDGERILVCRRANCHGVSWEGELTSVRTDHEPAIVLVPRHRQNPWQRIPTSRSVREVLFS